MIHQVIKAVIAATGPSRLLDVQLHEVVTGNFCMCIHKPVQETSRLYGKMLLDRGSERLWISVPCYTDNVDEAANLLPPNMSLKLTKWGPPIIAALKNVGFTAKWTASLWTEDLKATTHIANHETSGALCVCLLALYKAANIVEGKDTYDNILREAMRRNNGYERRG